MLPPYILAENHINPWVGTRFLVFHHHKNPELFTKFCGVLFYAITWKMLVSWGKRMAFEMHAKNPTFPCVFPMHSLTGHDWMMDDALCSHMENVVFLGETHDF